jgi:hypothetical protein
VSRCSKEGPCTKARGITFSITIRIAPPSDQSRLVAEQRVLHLHGDLPRGGYAKGLDTTVTKFMKRYDDIMLRDDCDRTVAMQTAGQEHPSEFDLFRLV